MTMIPITPEEAQDFVDWTRVKIKIHASVYKRFPHKREIWWISLGKNVGVEMNGKHENFERPALVIRQYNNDASLILPVTSQQKEGNWFYDFVGASGESNSVNLSQLRTVSHKRFLRRVGKMDSSAFLEIKEKLKNFV